MNIRDRRLWKRIWWILYVSFRSCFDRSKLKNGEVRDRTASSSLGRPIRIRDEDCDVEPLEESDFEEDGDVDKTVFGTYTRFNVLYVITMTKLAVICKLFSPTLKVMCLLE
jgi:hypothetical protein